MEIWIYGPIDCCIEGFLVVIARCLVIQYINNLLSLRQRDCLIYCNVEEIVFKYFNFFIDALMFLYIFYYIVLYYQIRAFLSISNIWQYQISAFFEAFLIFDNVLCVLQRIEILIIKSLFMNFGWKIRIMCWNFKLQTKTIPQSIKYSRHPLTDIFFFLFSSFF